MFLKLKASLSPLAAVDAGDKEGRRRRRLSKPLTNKSSTNLLILSAQQSEDQSNNTSAIDVSPASLSTPSSHENVLDLLHSPIADSKQDTLRSKTLILQEGAWNGTAFTINDEDPVPSVDSPTLLSLKGSTKPKRPLSAMFAPRFSGSRKASDFARRRVSLQALSEGGPDTTEKNKATATLLCSSEHLPEALPPRLQRRSSFTPGVATRTSRKASLGPSPEEEQPGADQCYYYNPSWSEESPLSRLDALDFDEEWAPPAPPIARSETPSDLDYTHLGGLRLGSLRVTNGRASPAPSDLSRHLTGASTPSLRRDASSNYGDGEEGALVTLASLRQKSYWVGDRGLQDVALVARKPTAAPVKTHNDAILLPKRTVPKVDSCYSGVKTTTTPASVSKVEMPWPQPISYSPDKTSQLAMSYMAELCASPYAEDRPSSPTGSVLKATSKASEIDDNLFEDDGADLCISEEVVHLSPGTQHSSNDAVWLYESAYRLSVKRSRDTSPRSSLQPSNSTGSSASFKPDSGYGSKISLHSEGNRPPGAAGKLESPVPSGKRTQAEAVDINTTRGRPEAQLTAMPLRPSILKRSGTSAPEIPTFLNLYPSTTTLATAKSTTSAPSDAPTKSRKLQKKTRPRSQPPPARQIVIQGQHRDMSGGDVPPIPSEIATNLAIRTQQVPELDHTFSSMHHTRETENSPKPAHTPTYVDFPSTGSSTQGSLTVVDLPSPPPHRSSFMMWSKNERRDSQRRSSDTSGISEGDAMAIIRDLNTAVSSVGGSPYDIASKTQKPSSSQAAERKTRISFHHQTRDLPWPKPMMDDATAAELARLRSRTIIERDGMQWKQRQSSFNDRGGIPGKNIRPLSTAEDAPPLPSLPSREQVRRREVQRADYERPYPETRATESTSWPEQFRSDLYESLALPPSRPPPSRPTELEGDIPPHPPSHSPRPVSIGMWEGTPAPPPPSHSPRQPSTHSSDEFDAPPPPSHSPRPMSLSPPEDVADIWAAQALAWKSRRKSIGEMLRPRISPPEEQHDIHPIPAHESAIDDMIYPTIPLRRPQRSFVMGSEEYGTSSLQFNGAPPEPVTYELSQNERPQLSAQVARVSDGLNYGYEHEAGYGGSTGSSSVTGFAKASRKGVPLSEGFGRNLSDFPISFGIRRKPVGCL